MMKTYKQIMDMVEEAMKLANYDQHTLHCDALQCKLLEVYGSLDEKRIVEGDPAEGRPSGVIHAPQS